MSTLLKQWSQKNHGKRDDLPAAAQSGASEDHLPAGLTASRREGLASCAQALQRNFRGAFRHLSSTIGAKRLVVTVNLTVKFARSDTKSYFFRYFHVPETIEWE